MYIEVHVSRYSRHICKLELSILFVLNENVAKHLHLEPCQSPSCHMGYTPRKITL